MMKLGDSKEFRNIVNNVNNRISNNDISVNPDKKKYMLDKSKFKPNTEESMLAEEISITLNDLNYAGFFDIVKKLGCPEARRLLSVVLDDIRVKANTKTPVRNSGAYFVWKYKTRNF